MILKRFSNVSSCHGLRTATYSNLTQSNVTKPIKKHRIWGWTGYVVRGWGWVWGWIGLVVWYTVKCHLLLQTVAVTLNLVLMSAHFESNWWQSCVNFQKRTIGICTMVPKLAGIFRICAIGRWLKCPESGDLRGREMTVVLRMWWFAR